jgi:site-specific DNA-methyltransferase (adenine-specific)
MTVKKTPAKPNTPKPIATRLVAVETLTLDPTNANEHTPEGLRADADSLEQFGQVKPIVVDKNGVIKAGNGTYRAATEVLGWTHIVVTDSPPGELADAYALADNRTAEHSKRNPLKVGTNLAALAGKGVDISRLGWNDAERKGLLALTKPPSPAAAARMGAQASDEDTIPEPPKVPVTKRGDVWKLGDHVMICGDSFDPANRARLLGGREVDCVLTDPPYAIYGSSTGIGADIADDRMVRPFFENLFRMMLASVKPFGHVYVCCDWRSLPAIADSSRAAREGGRYGLAPKNVIVWDKGHGLGSMYAQTHEFIAFYTKTPAAKAMKTSATTETGQRMVLQKNVFKHERAHGVDRQHNAAKPPPLFRWLLENSTDPGELVVDFFGGSGTTVVVAEQTGRRAALFEAEPKHCDVVIERFERLSGKKAKRLKAA